MFVCFKCLNNYSSKQRFDGHKCIDIEKKISDKKQCLLFFDVLVKLGKKYDLNFKLDDNNIIDNDNKGNNINNINNGNIVNNVYNNVYNINIYNLNDNIDVKSLINKEFYEEYYTNTITHFTNIQESLDAKKYIIANPSKSLFADKSNMKDCEHKIKINSERVISHLSDKLTSLFELILFSKNLPQYHMIYVPDENDRNNFFIHIRNYWNCSDIQYLENNYIYHFFKFFVKGFKDYEFEKSSKLTEYIYDNCSEKINNMMSIRFFKTAYTHRNVVANIFEKTKNIKISSPFVYTSPNIIDTFDKSVNIIPKHKKASASKIDEKIDWDHVKRYNDKIYELQESNNYIELAKMKSVWETDVSDITNNKESVHEIIPKTRKAHNGEIVDFDNTIDAVFEEINGKKYIIDNDNYIYENPEDLEDMGLDDLNKVGIKLSNDDYHFY